MNYENLVVITVQLATNDGIDRTMSFIWSQLATAVRENSEVTKLTFTPSSGLNSTSCVESLSEILAKRNKELEDLAKLRLF